MEEVRELETAAGGVLTAKQAPAGPAPPRRSVCAPAAMSQHSVTDQPRMGERTMSLFSWLRNLRFALRNSQRQFRRRGSPRAWTHRPHLEELECRIAPSGAELVKDINLNTVGSSPDGLVEINGSVFFAATDQTHGRELWKTDGTAEGTVLVKDINPGSAGSSPVNLTAAGGTLFFTASDGVHGTELWRSDGTAAGTVMVKDIW